MQAFMPNTVNISQVFIKRSLAKGGYTIRSHFLQKSIDKTTKQGYNDNRKRQDLKRLCQEISYLCNNRLARGGYCAFMGNIIIKIINTKSAMSSFFAISTMLTFHKHTPFHRLGISACEYKSVGITAGVNTVKKSRL